ncbi:hypothetical protein [Streptomyces sp. AK04-3B]|uniref:hypothetical protein n=1 Tax=Streptomyces sp. AK04-3B TaxID=3028650 RepID=UPI0029A47741|nr:hypothetical protein [Streptomyces sp. AK04-3B]MDX3801981.1 hypothetical protein [Streptomyces sp. AK04-3B]
MAKQRITVCLPPVGPDGLKQAIGQAMAPFWYDREDRPHPDWVGEWSYWFVSGAGCLLDVLPGHEDDPRLVRYDDWTEPPDDLPPSRCHGGPRGILDLGAARAAEARRAAGDWTAYRAFADRHPPALPFHHFEERARAALEPEQVQEAAVAAFCRQPLIQAIRADPALEERFASDPVLRFDEDLETYVARHAAAVLPTPALLTLDGRWVEGGGPDYARVFNACLDGLPADSMVVRVLYHS